MKAITLFFILLTLTSFLPTGATRQPDLSLFSDSNSAEENRLAIIDRYGEWIQEYDQSTCNFRFYKGIATPIFFLQWFLGTKLESKMQYAECRYRQNNISHILLDVISPSKPKQRFIVAMRSITKAGEKSPYYSETTYTSKGSFIQSIENNRYSKTLYNIHHKYRNKSAELESGEIQHPVDLPNKAQSYASLMTHVSDLVHFNNTFSFLMTDPYSAAIQDEVVEYPMWRNKPLQIIKAKRNKDNSISMRGWFPYAFGQLHANIDICLGESKLPDLIEFRHLFMDVDLWRSSGVSSNECKIAYDKNQVEKQIPRFSASNRNQ